MREIRASEAKIKLSQLLDEVERGETAVITGRGRAIARITPEANCRQREIAAARADIEELRKQTGKISVAELLAWRHEGHKY